MDGVSSNPPKNAAKIVIRSAREITHQNSKIECQQLNQTQKFVLENQVNSFWSIGPGFPHQGLIRCSSHFHPTSSVGIARFCYIYLHFTYFTLHMYPVFIGNCRTAHTFSVCNLVGNPQHGVSLGNPQVSWDVDLQTPGLWEKFGRNSGGISRGYVLFPPIEVQRWASTKHLTIMTYVLLIYLYMYINIDSPDSHFGGNWWWLNQLKKDCDDCVCLLFHHSTIFSPDSWQEMIHWWLAHLFVMTIRRIISGTVRVTISFVEKNGPYPRYIKLYTTLGFV